MNVVEARSLGRRYGRRWALKHLDLDVPQHAVVGLVGPNGAGKSTLLHLVAGLIDPTEGNVSVLGGTPGSAAVLPDVAFVAQDSPLPKRARVREIASIPRLLLRRLINRIKRRIHRQPHDPPSVVVAALPTGCG